MNTIDCPKEDCSAPLCPLDERSIRHGIWYPQDEEICKRRDFQSVDWIAKQQQLTKAKAPSDKFFTVAMIQAITRVQKGITGIDPDQPFEQANKAEQGFIEAFTRRQNSKANKDKKHQNSLDKKRRDSGSMTADIASRKGGRHDT